MPIPHTPELWTYLPVESQGSWFNEHLTFSLYCISCLPEHISNLSNPLFQDIPTLLQTLQPDPPQSGLIRFIGPHNAHLCLLLPHQSSDAYSTIMRWAKRHRHDLSSAIHDLHQHVWLTPEGNRTDNYREYSQAKGGYIDNYWRGSFPLLHLHMPIVSDCSQIPANITSGTCVISPNCIGHMLPYPTLDKTAMGLTILSSKLPKESARKAAVTRTSNIKTRLQTLTIPAPLLNNLIISFLHAPADPLPAPDTPPPPPPPFDSPRVFEYRVLGKIKRHITVWPDLDTAHPARNEITIEWEPFPRTLSDSTVKKTRFAKIDQTTANIDAAADRLWSISNYLCPTFSPKRPTFSPEALPLVRSRYWPLIRSRFSDALRALVHSPSGHLLTWYPLPSPDWVSRETSYSYFMALNNLRSVLLTLTHNLSLPFPLPALGSPIPPALRGLFEPMTQLLFCTSSKIRPVSHSPTYYKHDTARSNGFSQWTPAFACKRHLEHLVYEEELKQRILARAEAKLDQQTQEVFDSFFPSIESESNPESLV